MQIEDLLVYRANIYSQNGEDGIIRAIFSRIGTTTQICCEFGAWDGIHLSNCRNLVNQGWTALMIEGDENRFTELASNYATNTSVVCVNRYVDAGPNSLGEILNVTRLRCLDFLSIDIDGLDYEIFETLDIHPRVICVEVNAGHNPETQTRISREIAKENVGQPLAVFAHIAEKKGYNLVCYTGNAFFVSSDLTREYSLPVLSSKLAYRNFLNSISTSAKEWLYLVNLGIVNPYLQFHNPHLNATALRISVARATWLRLKHIARQHARRFKHGLTNIITVHSLK